MKRHLQSKQGVKQSAPISASLKSGKHESYTNWKKHYLDEYTMPSGEKRARVVQTRNGNNDVTVSEGMGYGMMLAVRNDDEKSFHEMFNYIVAHRDNDHLLNWKLDKTGVIGKGSATDADDDIAYAFVEASKKWGGPYTDMADNMITAIAKYDVYENDGKYGSPKGPMMLPGDQWGSKKGAL